MTERWGGQRAAALAEEVGRFVSALELHAHLRRRLQSRGYDEQAHRELQSCLSRITATGAASTADTGSWPGSVRAVVGWAAAQARSAGAALGKLPAVARQAAFVARALSEKPPEEALRASTDLIRRVQKDEHLGQFLTLKGLRAASTELRQRLAEDGSPEARAARQQTHAELAYLYHRWRKVAQEEFHGDPAALAALGLT